LGWQRHDTPAGYGDGGFHADIIAEIQIYCNTVIRLRPEKGVPTVLTRPCFIHIIYIPYPNALSVRSIQGSGESEKAQSLVRRR
ncbi:MAG TPA: hypothetical protein VJ834_17400, partial [Burkholderiales bacterium]|nr:hypothetical protein [Burkholderiales bacterium]